MKPTTTPNGATLMWLEAGDTYQSNDFIETSWHTPIVIGSEDVGGLNPGDKVKDIHIGWQPRRYIPKEET